MKLQFYKNYTLGDLYNLYVPDESTSEEDAEKAFQEFYNTLKSDGLSDEEISNLFEEATYKLLYGLSGCYGYCEKLDNYNQIPEPCKLKERGS